MVELTFDCLDVVPVRYAAAPTLGFRLRVAELSGTPVHAIVLSTQIRVEPQRRRYSDTEAELLAPVFGERARWGETLRPMQFATTTTTVPGFTGSVEVTVDVPCTYDMEVATGTYFHALSDGEVPMALLFSGTVFARSDNGFHVHPVPWHLQADIRMPVTVWEDLMQLYFPGEAWLRLPRDTVDALLRFKARNGIPTWDGVLTRLLEGAAP